jgi:tetratricopeptide (TPR) repeat protein
MIEEKDEYKPILAKYGEIANDYAHKAYKINPKDKEVVAACLVAFGYYSSSFGIFKAIFKGAAGHYKDLAKELIELDDKHSGGLGYRSLGRLYHMAPWPVGSSKKALKYFHKAAGINKAVLESHYFLGFIYFDKDKYDLAKKEFTYVVDNPPWDEEKHYIEEYKKESQKYLKKIEKIQKKKKR